jgi:hypothetical protein
MKKILSRGPSSALFCSAAFAAIPVHQHARQTFAIADGRLFQKSAATATTMISAKPLSKP